MKKEFFKGKLSNDNNVNISFDDVKTINWANLSLDELKKVQAQINQIIDWVEAYEKKEQAVKEAEMELEDYRDYLSNLGSMKAMSEWLDTGEEDDPNGVRELIEKVRQMNQK